MIEETRDDLKDALEDDPKEEWKDTWIESRINKIRARIKKACLSVGRDPAEVKLLLATKTVPVERINHAIDLGEMLIGENKVQELQQKYPFIQHDNVECHFIGHLQTNKVKDVLKCATFIQSVDRLKLGKALHDHLTKENKKVNILIQVNTSYEDSKFGVAPEEAVTLVEQLAEFDTLQIKGLMTIGKLTQVHSETRECFQLLRSIQQTIQAHNIAGVEMDVLSMGMSGDLEIAIEEGATMIRVGTAIFGERIYPDSYYWNEQNRVAD